MTTPNFSTGVLESQPTTTKALQPERRTTATKNQSVAHHKDDNSKNSSNKIYYKNPYFIERSYGVPQARRILTLGIFHKRHNDIRWLLISLGLENKERDAILGLLRLHIYYGKVYPKAADLAEGENISRRTFWRAVARLRDLELLEVINRYFNHRQISNLYRFDKLVLMIARYLAEHGQAFNEFATKLLSFFSSFWRDIWQVDIDLDHFAPVRLKFV